MTLEQLIDAGYSAQKAADALGITRSAAIGRAWRLGLHFHSDDPGGVRLPRGNQHVSRAMRLAAENERGRERRRKEREARAAENEAKRAPLKAQFHKPGRIVALCGWMS